MEEEKKSKKENRWHRNIGRRYVPVVCGLLAARIGRAKGQGQTAL